MDFLTHKFARVSVPAESFRFPKGLLHLLESDLKARAVWYDGACTRRALWRALVREGSLAAVLLRIGEHAARHRLARPFMVGAHMFLRTLYHVTVGRGAVFGPGLVLLHPHGLFIHKTVLAGVNLVLQNDLTLGGEDDRGPQIGDNVFIGVGTRVIGPVTLGHRCRVGANAVVMVSVKDDHVAAGNPARQIPIAPSAREP